MTSWEYKTNCKKGLFDEQFTIENLSAITLNNSLLQIWILFCCGHLSEAHLQLYDMSVLKYQVHKLVDKKGW